MKLKCNTIQQSLSDYIDDTLSTEDTRTVEVHLESCQKCQHEVVSLKKTRDLVVSFYVEPEVSDTYFQQFEMELRQRIDKNGPTKLNQRVMASATQYAWYILTQFRQYFDRYSFIRRNVLPMGVFLSIMIVGLVSIHLVNHNMLPFIDYPQEVQNEAVTTNPTPIEEQTEFLQNIHNERRTKRNARGEVSSPRLTDNTEKEGYWKLSDPVTTDTGGHIIVMHISNDRSVPSDASDSELTVYPEPNVLSRKSPLEDDSYTARPLESEVVAFSENIQPKNRKLSGFVAKVMHVPSEILTIPGLHVLSNL
ncbi:zf-HC2 domain-containing protein [Candidatus Poribacteria bacterium]|nr:zf-HC2 domain-containing protein [Candidatus Poribacteria bacterium]